MEEEQREMNRVADATRDQINNIRLEIRSTKSSIETLKSEKRVMVVKHFESQNDEAARSFYAQQLSEIDQEIKENKTQLEALVKASTSVELPSPQRPNNINKRVYSLLNDSD